MPLAKNQIIPLSITALSSDGSGVGRWDGMPVFVPFTAVGDEVDARIVKVCRTYAYGIIDTLRTPGPARIPAQCHIYGKCGGCCLRHIRYEAELCAKQGFVADAMRRIGGVSAPVLPTLASPQQERYRNKVQYPLCRDENGAVCAGFYASRSHRIIPCEDCLLQPALLNEIARTACRLLTQLGVSVYDEATHRGFARHIYLRHSVKTDDVLFCLVANGRKFPQAQTFCRELKARHPQVCGVVLNVNTRDTNVVLGGECITLAGEGTLSDEMAGVPVRLSPLSFYQVNTRGANALYAKALELAGLTGRETLLDLYCGTGTIGLSMAHRCARLIGVEIVPEAVVDAQRNAARMGVQHTEFLCADAQKAAALLEKQGLRPDVVVLDPPRKGCGDETLAHVCAMQPQRIVMVSCNPATAARDTAYLAAHGYTPVCVQPVDMFPRTKHVETVVLLSKLNAKQHIEVELNLDELDLTSAESKATYDEIKAYVLEKYGLKVSSLYISQVKRKCGLDVGQNYNLSKKEDAKVPQCPPEKKTAIMEALRYFQMI